MTINLPELPAAFDLIADHVRAYALAAVEQDRAWRPALTDDQIEPYLRHIPEVVTVGWLQEMIRAVHRDFCFEQDRAGRWSPISTAPNDGALLVLGARNGVWLGKYKPGYRPEDPWSSMMLNHDHMAERYTRPTHWQPLPSAPAQGERNGS